MRKGLRHQSVVLALAVTAGAVGFTPNAFAQNEADKATARQLGLDGDAALASKDFKTAEDKCKRADALFHAPTLMLCLARAQAGNGHLVAAQENYNRILREGAPAGSPPAFVKAVADARKEVDEVSSRIAEVVVQVTGADNPSVTLDGQPFSNAALGVKRPVDPGDHVVKATAPGYKPGEAHFNVVEAGDATASIELQKDPNAPVASAGQSGQTPGPNSGPGSPVEPPPAGSTGGGSLNKTLGYAALGVGAAGVVVGGIFGVLAIGAHGSLADECQNGTCDSTKDGDVSSYHTKGLVSTIGFVVGGVGLAAGAVLILTAPKSHAEAHVGLGAGQRTFISPYVGPGSAGITGKF